MVNAIDCVGKVVINRHVKPHAIYYVHECTENSKLMGVRLNSGDTMMNVPISKLCTKRTPDMILGDIPKAGDVFTSSKIGYAKVVGVGREILVIFCFCIEK